MNILITGAKGFIGKNLISMLNQNKVYNIYQYDIDCEIDMLDMYACDCDFVFHLAGVNRPNDEVEFNQGNVDFTSQLLNYLKKNNNRSPILFSSSIQADMNNPYGKSKKKAEDLLLEYSKLYEIPIYIFRLPNIFGKWCRPNYNSVVATFCYNIANGYDIIINDLNASVTLVYIDDVIKEFVKTLEKDTKCNQHYLEIPLSYNMTLGSIAECIYTFNRSRSLLSIVDLSDEFTAKLYATYLSYLPTNNFSYPLHMNVDERGSFTEFIRTPDRGQVSVSITKPGVTKGNHWHQTKNEKFLVVKGTGIIRFRLIGLMEVIVYNVDGDMLKVVDIPTGYTHSIENTGNNDMITIIWSSELFDPDNPDTIYEKV